MGRRLNHLLAALLIAAAGISTLAGCASRAEEHPAVTVIRELLELRRDDSRDAKEYEPYFLDPELAAALAEGSDEPTGTPQVPEWEDPYLSEETSDSVSVVVVWKLDDDFKDWPAVNVFSLSFTEDRWVVVDAVEATLAPEPLKSQAAK